METPDMEAPDITHQSIMDLRQYCIIRQEHSAGDFAVEKGSFSQEYFVYFKKK